jgi:putative ABC transport system permease protein
VKPLLILALKSAWNRRYTLGLTMIAVALSVTLLLGIERLRHDAHEGFAQSVSGTDLVVGPRSSPIQLLLYAVFHLGEATNNMEWSSVQTIARNPEVAWVIPLSLGDSHKGFPVLATNGDYFKHFRYGDHHPLQVIEGRPFHDLYDAVLGADVADKLHYKLGDKIVLSHGMSGNHLTAHADKPFTVAGILARTGTPVDRTVHISLQAMEAIHLDWQAGAPIPGFAIPPQFAEKFDLTPKTVTAMLVGLKSRIAVFSLQRELAGFEAEPLMAVLPGVALDQLWNLMGVAERVLLAVSGLVVAVSLAGLVAVVLAGLNERRRELAILRSVGAGPWHLIFLLTLEGAAVTVAGALLGTVLLTLLAATLGPWAELHYGVVVHVAVPSPEEFKMLGAVVAVGTLASLLPGLRAYRMSLSDGLTPRV